MTHTLTLEYTSSGTNYTRIDGSNATFNYGNTSQTRLIGIGAIGLPAIYRTLAKFAIPALIGTVKSLKLGIYIFGGSITDEVLAIHKMVDAKDPLWVQGNDSGALTTLGATWNEYIKDLAWAAAGSDYESDPIAVKQILTTDVGWIYIDIPLDLFSISANNTYSFVLKFADETTVNNFITLHPQLVQFVIESELPALDAPDLVVNSLSSSDIRQSWAKSTLPETDFQSYEVEQSDTGVGGWSNIATIVDQDTLSFDHTGIIVQGDVDDFDDALDTYPSGRTKYYRMRINSDSFGAGDWSDVESAVTIPVAKSFTMSYTNRSEHWNEEFELDNYAQSPFGVEATVGWYDTDETLSQYLDKLEVTSTTRRNAGGWTAPVVHNLSLDDIFENISGLLTVDEGFGIRKITTKLYDTGGLYRKSTLNLTTEQIDIDYISPAPGGYAMPLTTPLTSGDIENLDLSFVAQQDGDDLFLEDFAGTFTNKWGYFGAGAPSYAGGNRIQFDTALIASGAWGVITKKLNEDDSSIPYWALSTSSYKVRMVIKVTSFWSGHTWEVRLPFAVTGYGFTNYTAYNSSRKYFVHFDSSNTIMYLYTRDGSGYQLLAQVDVGVDSPKDNYDSYFGFEFFFSPTYRVSGYEALVGCLYRVGTSVSDALNFDIENDYLIMGYDTYNTTQYLHGTAGAEVRNSTGTLTDPLLIYHYRALGRVGEVGVGQGYASYSPTLGEQSNLIQSSNVPLTVKCSPDLASEVIDYQGMIKNEYGGHSRMPYNPDQSTTVNNADPVAVLAVPSVGFTDANVLVDAGQSIDPEGGALIYEYDFGDSSPILQITDSFKNHLYTTAGTYTVKLRVQDEVGNWSTQVQKDVVIYDVLALFEEVTLMSPWTNIAQAAPSGSSVTELPEMDYDDVQHMKGGNRVFNLAGYHNDPDCDHSGVVRMANAEAELAFFTTLRSQGTLITLDLEYFGLVKGVIADHKPSMNYSDQTGFNFTITFQEVDIRQFE